MIRNAEKFLLKCVTKHDVETFDELRYLVFHEKHLVFDIERFPPTSDSMRQHILRAYFQCYKWTKSPFLEDIALDPLDYGYCIDEDDKWSPLYQLSHPFPATFPIHVHVRSVPKQLRASVEYLILLAASTVNVMQALSAKIDGTH